MNNLYINYSNLNYQGGITMNQYIITNALKEVEGSSLRPCIKQEVFAMVVTAEGKEYFGANWMSNDDLTVCPRVTANSPSGKDYHFCSDICNQLFHAERFAMQACEAAGDSLIGATVFVAGHTYCCQYCIAAMMHAGIKKAYVVDSSKAADWVLRNMPVSLREYHKSLITHTLVSEVLISK